MPTIQQLITAVDILIYTSIADTQEANRQDVDIQRLNSYIVQGQPHTKDNVEHGMQKYWPIRHEPAVIDGIAMKDKLRIVPFTL